MQRAGRLVRDKWQIVVALWLAAANVSTHSAWGTERLDPNQATGSSLAVAVPDVPLVHTRQVTAVGATGSSAHPDDAGRQTTLILQRLTEIIRAAKGDPQQVARLHICVTQESDVPQVASALAAHFPSGTQPAVSYVVSRLPGTGTRVAIDAVAVAAADTALAVQPDAGLLPPGRRIYVAGQAEKGASLGEATRKTLESLRRTLEYLGRSQRDIVQVKSFLSPMANVAEAERELAAFFGGAATAPPCVWVEWTSALIEIEVVAWGGPAVSGAPIVEYLTPPGMTASPVYSRVARTNAPERLIYSAGLYSRNQADGAGEVTDVFTQLSGIAERTKSDLKHLVKATYYCSTNETSTKLNELRPRYYDPQRPPSASKAMVAGVGRPERGLTLDMILVTTK